MSKLTINTTSNVKRKFGDDFGDNFDKVFMNKFSKELVDIDNMTLKDAFDPDNNRLNKQFRKIVDNENINLGVDSYDLCDNVITCLNTNRGSVLYYVYKNKYIAGFIKFEDSDENILDINSVNYKSYYIEGRCCWFKKMEQVLMALTGKQYRINNLHNLFNMQAYKAGTILWAMFLKYVNDECKISNNEYKWFICNIPTETAKGYHERMGMKTYEQLNDNEKGVAKKHGFDDEYLFYFPEVNVDYDNILSIIDKINQNKILIRR